MTEKHGTIWWSELMTRDPDAARRYYGSVCGWEWSTMPMGTSDYHIASVHGRPVAGMMDMTEMTDFDGMPPHWFTYVAVDDVDTAANATAASGGKVMRQPWDIPGTGRIAIIEDPTGAAVGLMTPSEQAG